MKSVDGRAGERRRDIRQMAHLRHEGRKDLGDFVRIVIKRRKGTPGVKLFDGDVEMMGEGRVIEGVIKGSAGRFILMIGF